MKLSDLLTAEELANVKEFTSVNTDKGFTELTVTELGQLSQIMNIEHTAKTDVGNAFCELLMRFSKIDKQPYI